ncbi:hypothetical protein STA3757_12080 [Stanieria sp. NIES-3757]|nr:hypothetical protein STA3757_12080 [Stanieria sp. NIES-3757]
MKAKDGVKIAIAILILVLRIFLPNFQQKPKIIAVTTGEIPKNKASIWGTSCYLK